MNHTLSRKATTAILLAAALSAGLAACTQPGPGPQAMAGMAMGPHNTHGWMMMSAQEREAHHASMMGMKSPSECMAHDGEHQRRMADRARERGMPMDAPPNNACEQMRMGGMWK
jgi:hypothetical protein